VPGGKQAGLGTTGTGCPKPDGSENPFWLHKTFTSGSTRSPKKIAANSGSAALMENQRSFSKNLNQMLII